MSLLDLKSDLSKFRYNAPKPTNTLPRQTQQQQNPYGNNFGSYKPISDGLITNIPNVIQSNNIDLVGKLKDTRLDDAIKNTFNELLINSVSEYSPKTIEYNFGSPSNLSIESVTSAFSRINKDIKQSNIDKSNIIIERTKQGINNNDSNIIISQTQQGTNNNESNVEIIDNGSEVGNIQNPNVTLNNIPLTYERQRQSVDITVNPNDSIDNIQNPNVTLNNIPLTFNRELESLDLEKGFGSKEFIINANSNKLLSDSILNIDRTPEKYRTQSKIENKEITEKVDTTRYNGQISDLAISDSILDLTNPEKTLLSGRHETDTNSLLSNSKDNVVDYFDNENAEGFTKKIQPLNTEYVNNSSTLGYETILEANYFDITNQYTTDGFESFAKEYDSKYKSDASKYDWEGSRENAPEANYFDVNKKFTKGGFTSFAEKFNTEYKTDSSEFDWDGNRRNAPQVNYFDLSNINTTVGFHSFAIEYDTKYINDSSKYDWNGIRKDAPQVNYFDLSNINTTVGFHTFAQNYDTKYIPESSDFDWDGLRAQAPQVNYFDLSNINTTVGFHSFAIIKDSKYIPESSNFDWDGLRTQAPQVNYFDNILRFTSRGFHTFATTKEPTAYTNDGVSLLSGGPGVGTSDFDWDGISANAPTNDFLNPNGYFDQNNKFTTQGFHTFAQIKDTKYIPESSEFDWDGLRAQAPTNDINNPNGYFDITNAFTTQGFHTFAQNYDTKYIPESSDFDWDGLRAQAPTNDRNNPNGYFDQIKRFTSRGFHTFATTKEPTAYTNDGVSLLSGGPGVGTSDFDWDGLTINAPTNDFLNPNGYFDRNKKFTTQGFHTFAQIKDTKYIPESSEFDWDGLRAQAPTNDALNPNGYFDQIKRFTSRGFHTFATTKEPTAYTNDGVSLLSGGPGVGTSDFDWDGISANAPTNDFLNPNGYFDQINRFTYRGFHTFATTKEPTSYTNTNQGQPISFGGVSLLGGLLGFGSSDLDWDGNGSQFSPTTNQISPAVNYLDSNNRFTYRGFHIGAVTKEPTSYTNTNQGQPILSGGISLLSGAPGVGTSDFDWDGINEYGQNPTRYFGFTPGNQFGFLIRMSQNDGTTYPIINPSFDYNTLAIGINQTSNRSAFAGLRLSSQPLQTTNLELFAPLTFSGKNISGFKATLDNQSPVVNVQKYGFNITGYRRRGKAFGQYIDQITGNIFSVNQSSQFVQNINLNKYTDGGGVDSRPTYVDGEMAVWANSGDVNSSNQTFSTVGPGTLTSAQVVALNRSFNGLPYYNGTLYKSHIDYQYTKYNLVRDSYNTDTVYQQPFIDSSLIGEDRDILTALRVSSNIPNTINIPGAGTTDLSGIKNTINSIGNFLNSAQSFDEGIVRGGLIKNIVRTILDTKRITKFLLSTRGLLWNAKQIGLQFMNPRVDTGPGIFDGVLGLNWTNIYNPLSVPLNVIGRAGILGIRAPRHGLPGLAKGAYEDITVSRNENTDDTPFYDFNAPSFFNRTSNYNRLISLTKELLPQSYRPILLKNDIPKIDDSTEISRLSTFFGGPNSFLGLFGTTINRSTHPFKVVNSTQYSPVSDDILIGKDREIFFGGIESDDNEYTDISETGNTAKYSDFLTRNSDEVKKMSGIILGLKDYIQNTTSTDPIGAQRITANRLKGSMFDDLKYPANTERVKAITNVSLENQRSSNDSLNKNRQDDETDNPFNKFETDSYENLKFDTERLKQKADKLSMDITYDPSNTFRHHPSETNLKPYTLQDFRQAKEEKENINKNREDEVSENPFRIYETDTYEDLKFDTERLKQKADKLKDKTQDISETFKHNSEQIKLKGYTIDGLRSAKSGNPNLETNTSDDSAENPARVYASVTWDQLSNDGGSRIKDFRSNINSNDANSFISDPDVINFAENSLETRFGYGLQGKVKSNRRTPYISSIQYSSLLPNVSDDPNVVTTENVNANYKYSAYPTLNPSASAAGVEFRGDRINIIDWKRSTMNLSAPYVYEKYKDGAQSAGSEIPGAEDLIQFYFSGVNLTGAEYKPTEAIVFRAYIDTIVDNHKPSWTPIKYIGRADPVYSYDGYERDINFGFTVHIGSRDEMKASWRKLNMLASWTTPEYTDRGFMKAPIVRLNLGNLYRKFPGFLSSLTYTFDNTQTTWETAKLTQDQNLTDAEIRGLTMPGVLELPKTINVQCTFVTFNIYRPEWDCVFYSLYDDGAGNGDIETGLVPEHDDRVNYFRTFDDLPVMHIMNNQNLCAIFQVDPEEPEPEEPEPEEEPPPIVELCFCPLLFNIDEDRFPIDNSLSVIQDVIRVLNFECPEAIIDIIGRSSKSSRYDKITDKTYKDRELSYNRDLSRSRAISIQNLLIDSGLDPTRINQVIGLGFTRPIDAYPDTDLRQQQVEIIITNPREAGCNYKFNFNCPDKAECTSFVNAFKQAKTHRKNVGDQSEYWLVGPQHFTKMWEGSGEPPDEIKQAGDQDSSGNWWYRYKKDNDGNDIPDIENSWKEKYKSNNSFRIKGYSKQNDMRYKPAENAPYGVYRPWPNYKGKILNESEYDDEIEVFDETE